MLNKLTIKRILGKLPLTAEAYWWLRQRGKPPYKYFSLQPLEKRLPVLHQQAEEARAQYRWPVPARRVMIFTMLRKWVEHAAVFGMALGGIGHDVSLLYLPYATWQRHLNEFDQRRQNAYARKVLRQTAPLLKSLSLLDFSAPDTKNARKSLPASLVQAIEEVSLRDAQYTLQIEDFDIKGDTPSARLYRMRLEHNLYAASAAFAWIKAQGPGQRPDVILTPNGSILEMGAIYELGQSLGIPVMTYEFGEQRQRIWLAQNRQVMRQDTHDLWNAYQDQPLDETQQEQIRALYAARQNARLWENFSRQWQDTPSQGSQQVRQELGIGAQDQRPVILLAANVICDSLTLGRQVFTKTMSEWLQGTVRAFASRDTVHLIVRIHPGERFAKGPSVAEVVRAALPELPPHIHLVQATDPINTYDIFEIASLGLVYTTTTGMEMAMSGIPVIVGGITHYRGKGFTLDPESWEAFHKLLDEVLADLPKYRLTRQQTALAWQYAYRFFFSYPSPFPWHLQALWKDLDTWPMQRVLSAEGRAEFGDTFGYLVGKPVVYAGEYTGEAGEYTGEKGR